MTSAEYRPVQQFFPLDPGAVNDITTLYRAEPGLAPLEEATTLYQRNPQLRNLMIRLGGYTLADTLMLGGDYFSSGALLTHRLVRTATTNGTDGARPFADAAINDLQEVFKDVFDLNNSQPQRLAILESTVTPHIEAEPDINAYIIEQAYGAPEVLKAFYFGAGAMTACLRVNAAHTD